jgi:hypothetical protein
MKKNLGFTSFEFYFVMSVIGVIVLVGLQRYLQLGEETKRLNVEMLSHYFSASVYNHHARWIMAQEENRASLEVDGNKIQFSPQGWPLALVTNKPMLKVASVSGCLSLWNSFLQNPPSISYEGGDAYGTRTYHLSISPEANCRFEFITKHPTEYYFDYNPVSGAVIFHSPTITKNS